MQYTPAGLRCTVNGAVSTQFDCVPAVLPPDVTRRVTGGIVVR